MGVIAGRVSPAEIRDILDLGCGTGRFSNALASRFQSNLIGIDPSLKMLRQALNNRASRRVVYAAGSAEAIPLPAKSVDMIFISMVFHHFGDPRAAAEECGRALRSGGRLCLRTASREKISMYPYAPFFPASRSLLEQRLPSLAFQQEIFEAASFQTLSYEVVTQEIAPDYSSYADKLSVKADSILASLDEKDFAAGLEALRAHASATSPRAVTEPIDFFVFAKP
jgi:ubiquinone/menaquinone biosynthesis C-methylase UbiE